MAFGAYWLEKTQPAEPARIPSYEQVVQDAQLYKEANVVLAEQGADLTAKVEALRDDLERAYRERNAVQAELERTRAEREFEREQRDMRHAAWLEAQAEIGRLQGLLAQQGAGE